jgi:hypothetical protein
VNYNLLEENWIPVLRKDGRNSRVGIKEALTQAGEIRQIALASPLDFFAVHRFMLTLLYWKATLAGGVPQLREMLMKDQAVPSVVLDGIDTEAHSFDLFDPKSPFLQDPSVRAEKDDKPKSAGSLFAELATGTNIAHFHHGDDVNLRLCRPCTVLGMLRVVPWTQSGGQGLSPSIHNALPIMALATGDSLAVTLGLNLASLNAEEGKPQWSGHFKPTDPRRPIPYLEALTWNPRLIRLPPPQLGRCWYCGQKDVPTVGPVIIYKKNDDTKRQKKGAKNLPFIWKDPSAFYKPDQYEAVASAGERGAKDGADLGTVVSATSLVVSENPGHQGWYLVVPCTDKKNKAFDHRAIDLSGLPFEAVKALLPSPWAPTRQKGLDGWEAPKRGAPPGIGRFVSAAARLFKEADWVALSNAAYRGMHESPSAFDVFAGLYWGLGDREIGRLPSRNVAWLTLKLMAAVPAPMRAVRAGARFSPLDAALVLPKRQVKERGHLSPYPVSLPRGERLEACLREALDRNSRKRRPEPIDWVGLCHGLNQLLD